jgi:hypothetical protein
MKNAFYYIGIYYTSTVLIGGVVSYFKFKDISNKNNRNTLIFLNAFLSPLIPFEYIDEKIRKYRNKL